MVLLEPVVVGFFFLVSFLCVVVCEGLRCATLQAGWRHPPATPHEVCLSAYPIWRKYNSGINPGINPGTSLGMKTYRPQELKGRGKKPKKETLQTLFFLKL